MQPSAGKNEIHFYDLTWVRVTTVLSLREESYLSLSLSISLYHPLVTDGVRPAARRFLSSL